MTSIINLLMETCQRAERCPDFDLKSHLIQLQQEINQNKSTFNQAALGIISAAQIYSYKVDHLRGLCLNFKCIEDEKQPSATTGKHKLHEKVAEKSKKLRTKISDGCFKDFQPKEIHTKSSVDIQDHLMNELTLDDQEDGDKIEDILARLENGVYEQINLLQKLQVKECLPRLKDKDDKLGLEKDSRRNYSVFSGYVTTFSKSIVSCNEYERQLLEDKQIRLLAMPDTRVPMHIPALSRRPAEISKCLPIMNNDCDISNEVPPVDLIIENNNPLITITTETITQQESEFTENENESPANDNNNEEFPMNPPPPIVNEFNNNNTAPGDAEDATVNLNNLEKNEIRNSVDTGFDSDPARRSISDISDLSSPAVILHDIFGPKTNVDIPTIDGVTICFTHEPLVINFLKLPPMSAFQAKRNFFVPSEFRLTKRKIDEGSSNDKIDRNVRKIARIELIENERIRRLSIDFFGFEPLNNIQSDSKIDGYAKQIQLNEIFAEHYNLNVSNDENVEEIASSTVNTGQDEEQNPFINDESTIIQSNDDNLNNSQENIHSMQSKGNDSGIFSLNGSYEFNNSEMNETQLTEKNVTCTNESINDSGFSDEISINDDNENLLPKTSTPCNSISVSPFEPNCDTDEYLASKNQFSQKAEEIQEMEERVRLWHESLREKMSTFQRDYDVKVIANDIKRIRDQKPNGLTFEELMQNFDMRLLGRYFWSVLQLANENEIVLHHVNSTAVCEWRDFWIVKGDGNGK